MNPELTRQFGNRPIPLDRRQRHLGLVRPVVLLACPLHVLLPRHRRFLGAGLHLSQLSHFRGPAQASSLGKMPTTSVRRLISPLSRSSGLVKWIFGLWSLGKLIKASTSFSASSIRAASLAT